MRARTERFLLNLVIGASLTLASPAVAVTIDWVTVGDPGNAADTAVMDDYTTGYGAVPYAYRISKYEVTNAQYAEFLNAVAVGYNYGLYNSEMNSSPSGGITQTGSAGSFSYSVKTGFELKPVNFVSWVDAAYFANWLNNGQPVLPPDDPLQWGIQHGAYDLYGPNPISRNPDATIFLPSENEWYKAAYYDASSPGYFLWSTGSNVPTNCGAPTAAPNTANCGGDADGDTGPLSPTAVGSYPGSPSSYGTFDQAGNVWEWNEGSDLDHRGVRGGSFGAGYGYTVSTARYGSFDSDFEFDQIGFRVAATIPEPGIGLLLLFGLAGLGAGQRFRG